MLRNGIRFEDLTYIPGTCFSVAGMQLVWTLGRAVSAASCRDVIKYG